GIGHAGTLISAILLLFRQKWRTSINRSAEAMTIFAVMCAGLFPAIHLGRPWDAFFIFPYPNQRGPLWPNFRSPLVWDVFAISTYLTISLVFWYLGMIPDLATLRDRVANRIKKFVFGIFSLGWNGSHRTWARYETVSLIMGGPRRRWFSARPLIRQCGFRPLVIPGGLYTFLPAVLCGRSDLFRFWHGAYAVDHYPPDHAPGALYHDGTLGQNGQSHHVYRND